MFVTRLLCVLAIPLVAQSAPPPGTDSREAPSASPNHRDAAGPVGLTATPALPKRQFVLSDDFQIDRRRQYFSQFGEVDWEPGKMILRSGGTLIHRVRAGPIADLEVRLDLPPLPEDGQISETTLAFMVEGGKRATIVLLRKREHRKLTAEVQVRVTHLKFFSETLRQFSLPEVPLSGKWTLRYQYGLIRLEHGGVQLAIGYIDNGDQPVMAVALSEIGAAVSCRELSVLAPQPRAPLTPEQRRAVPSDETEREFGRLVEAGKSSEALQLGRKLLGAMKKAYGDELPDATGGLLIVLAEMAQSEGEYAEAQQYYEKAVVLITRMYGDRHPRTAAMLNNVAARLHAQGQYTNALRFCQRASQIVIEVLGERHLSTASTLGNMGEIHDSLGEYDRAEAFLRQAADIRRQLLGDSHPEYAAALNNLGAHYLATGDYARAGALLQQAKEIFERGSGSAHPFYGTTLHNLAACSWHTGDHVGAESLLRQALERAKQELGEKHFDYAAMLSSLAQIYQDMGESDRAEGAYREALSVFQQAHAEKHPYYAITLNGLAELYRYKVDFARAEPLYRQALKAFERVVGKQSYYYAGTLNNLACLYSDAGELASAAPLARESVDIIKRCLGEEHPAYATGLNNLALLYLDMGQAARAEPLAIQTLYTLRKHYERTSAALSERQLLAMISSLRFGIDTHLTLALAEPAQIGSDESYADVLAWKGIVFARQSQIRVARSHPEVAALWSELQQATSRLTTAANSIPAPQQRQIWQRQIADLTEKAERLETELSRRGDAFRQQRAAVRRSPKELRFALPRAVALIDLLEYDRHRGAQRNGLPAHYERRLVAFVVCSEQPIERIDLGPAAPIAEAIERWRSSLLADPPNAATSESRATELRRLVWQPLEPHLEGIHCLLVCPDGVLARLPLAALPGKRPGSYLIEEIPIAIVPVPQLLPELLADDSFDGTAPRSADARPASLLAIGDVDFDATPQRQRPAEAAPVGRIAARGGRMLQYGRLPETAKEVASVEDMFQQSHPGGSVSHLCGAEATEAAFRHAAPGKRYLHIATHGFFAPPELRSALDISSGRSSGLVSILFGQPGGMQGSDFPIGVHPGLLSGLAMAGANRGPGRTAGDALPGDDGILTAMEVAELDLSGTELAVLSACESGLGKPYSGEGMLGLQRAFQVSGARSTLASLWKVDDAATRALMQEFYRNLWVKKLGKLESLRQAQLTMLLHYDPGRKQLRGPGEARTIDARQMEEARKNLASGRRLLSPFYWAGFVLSGDWR